ncbi:MAG: carbohydrate ABC transporter permease [Eubacteriales bacterium]
MRTMKTLNQKKYKKKNYTIPIIGFFLSAFAIFAFIPFVYMVMLSFTQSESLSFNWSDLTLDFSNYLYVLNQSGFLRALLNSIYVAFMTCLLNNIICTMAAYSFAKKEFTGRKFTYGIYIATLAIPGQVTLIPLFTIMKELSLLNTYTALILPSINAFGVFLITQFMKDFPDELLEAGKIDGAGELRTFLGIVVPLVKPVIISLTVFTFISSWNNFLWPLVAASSDETKTLTVALSILKGHYTTNYGLVMAGATLSFLFPFTLYVVLQKQFVEGIALSGIKG